MTRWRNAFTETIAAIEAAQLNNEHQRMEEKEELDDPFLCEEQCEDRCEEECENLELIGTYKDNSVKEVPKEQQDILLDILKEMDELLKKQSKGA